jgi:hypothetical protein
MSVALSDKEVEAIREFVRRGGTLIADALPGIMDEHCTFRAARPLLDVLGVAALPATRETVIRASGEADLRLAGGRSMAAEDGRPILIGHRFGQGRAYLLNYFLHGYPKQRLEGLAQPELEKLARVLTDAGIGPKIRISGSAGERAAECATYLFNQDSTRLLGLIPDKSMRGPRRIRLSFDGAGAIYDVRRRSLAGKGTQWETVIEPGVPGLFAIVEEEISGIDARAAARVKPGQDVQVDFTISGGRGLRSVARVDVQDPAGRPVHCYSANTDIEDGKGTVRFQTALNDPTGMWRVTVTEVISGKKATVEVRLGSQ